MMDAITKRKIALKASSDQHKKAISKDLKALANKTDKVVGDTLLTIGVLLAALVVYKTLKGKRKNSRTSNRFLTVFKQQIGLYILNEGRSRLVDYIDSMDDAKE